MGEEQTAGIDVHAEDAVEGPDTPSFYANGVAVMAQVYDFQFNFTVKEGPGITSVVVARLHASPQLAKVLGRILRHHVREFEQRVGAIGVPAQLLEALNISDLDE